MPSKLHQSMTFTKSMKLLPPSAETKKLLDKELIHRQLDMHVVHEKSTYRRKSPQAHQSSFSLQDNSYGRDLGNRPAVYKRGKDPSSFDQAAGKRALVKSDN